MFAGTSGYFDDLDHAVSELLKERAESRNRNHVFQDGSAPSRAKASSLTVGDIRDHLEVHVGIADSHRMFDSGGSDIEVVRWRPGVTATGQWLLATIGGSKFLQPGADRTERREVFATFDIDMPHFGNTLAALVTMPRNQNAPLTEYSTYAFATPFSPLSAMHRILLLPANEEALPALQKPGDGIRVDFLWAIPVYASEIDYERANGTAALFEWWAARNISFGDPGRADTMPSHPSPLYAWSFEPEEIQ
jgi:hypothetical protein